jgi:serine phosphatase RsbU (regulator of sigma subunit)
MHQKSSIMIYLWLMRYGILFFCLSACLSVIGQTDQIDSLRRRLLTETKADTMRAFDLNEMAWQFLDYDTDSTLMYVKKAEALSRKIGYITGIADAKSTQGIIYRLDGQTKRAIRLYEEVIELRKQSKRPDRLTGAYANLGNVYFENGQAALALKYYQKAYDHAERYGQLENQLVLLNNIGAAYKGAGLYEQALDAFRQGLELNKKFNDDIQEAQLYLNIATVYDQRELFRESVKYNVHAYRIFKRAANLRQLSTVVYNLTIATRMTKDFRRTRFYLQQMDSIAQLLDEDDYTCLLYQTRANYYTEVGRNNDAMSDINKALQLVDSTQDMLLYANMVLVKSDVYAHLKQFDNALRFCDLGIELLSRLDQPIELSKAYLSKSEISKAKGDFKTALIYYEKAEELRKKIRLDEVSEQIATMNSLNELDMKDKQIELTNKEKEKVEAEKRRQYAQLIASVIIGLLAVVSLLFSVRAYRVKKKANVQLNHQKNKIETQKMLIEEKQTEILDSIHYAKRIQSTLLAQEYLIRKYLPESFIFFQPKDIVSGDFYWATEREGRFYLAVCDSTGHGVPGAFMSLLNISFLSEAINDRNIREPHEVLNHVRARLIESISQDGAQDGMDGILLCFDHVAGTITYAAAHNCPVLVVNGEKEEFPADKMPIGKGESTTSFTLHTIAAKPGAMLYLYTDGYADQFGGEKGKKFKYRQLDELLVANAAQPAASQQVQLEQTFVRWKGDLEQVDDVTVMGIRLNLL